MPGEQWQTVAPRSSHWVTVLIVLAGLFVVSGLLFLKISSGPSLRLRTCFQDASGLRPDAKVRSAGVDIGRVLAVRAQPNDKACLAAVEMEIRTPYGLKIPKDSVASTATAGVLGETYLEIDASSASGAPIEAEGQLPSKERTDVTVADVNRALKAIDELTKRLADAEKNCSAPAAKTQPAVKAHKSAPAPVAK